MKSIKPESTRYTAIPANHYQRHEQKYKKIIIITWMEPLKMKKKIAPTYSSHENGAEIYCCTTSLYMWPIGYTSSPQEYSSSAHSILLSIWWWRGPSWRSAGPPLFHRATWLIRPGLSSHWLDLSNPFCRWRTGGPFVMTATECLCVND